MQVAVPTDIIKTEIISDNEDDNDTFVKNIDITNQICNGIYADNAESVSNYTLS